MVLNYTSLWSGGENTANRVYILAVCRSLVIGPSYECHILCLRVVLSIPHPHPKSFLCCFADLIGGPVLVLAPLNIIQEDQMCALKRHNIKSARLDYVRQLDI